MPITPRTTAAEYYGHGEACVRLAVSLPRALQPAMMELATWWFDLAIEKALQTPCAFPASSTAARRPRGKRRSGSANPVVTTNPNDLF